jgi:hypothetical protein
MVRHTGEHFIDIESVAITTVLLLQSSGVYSPEFDASYADRFFGYSDASLCQENLDIAVT